MTEGMIRSRERSRPAAWRDACRRPRRPPRSRTALSAKAPGEAGPGKLEDRPAPTRPTHNQKATTAGEHAANAGGAPAAADRGISDVNQAGGWPGLSAD